MDGLLLVFALAWLAYKASYFVRARFGNPQAMQ
jgi:hypothetical protein